MEQYIPKAAVLAEIDRRLELLDNAPAVNIKEFAEIMGAQYYELINLAQYINNLEVKEVDLSLIEPHIKEEWNKINTGHTYSIIDSYNIFVGICTYFYELGLNARKEE